MDNDSYVEVRGSNFIINGPITVEGFSNMMIRDTLIGDVVCEEAGNVSCDSGTVIGTVQGCASCNP